MLHAVIMAGGIGERFWPLSTPERPKQLAPLLGNRPLLAHAVGRLEPVVPLDRVFIITSRNLEGPVKGLFPRLPAGNLVLEPIGKNTAPAAALVTLKILGRDPSGVIAMFPADHFIQDEERFQGQVLHASQVAERGYIVTFGISPGYPATGYGYIKRGELLEESEDGPVYHVGAFVEKPDLETAVGYLSRGDYLWNSGMFVWKGDVFLDEVNRYAPGLYRSLMAIRGEVDTEREGDALDHFYGGADKISVDYAVMERSDRMAVIPAGFRWDDLGSWTSLERISEATDEKGNVTIGNTILQDVHDSIVYASEGTVALVGVHDLVVVRVGEITMVCPKSKAEEVKKLARKWRDGEGGEE